MEQEKTTPQTTKKVQLNTVPIRVHKTTAKALKSILTKLNRKPLGRKVKHDDVIQKSLSLLNDEHIEEIKHATLSNSDRLEIAYQEYCKANGQVTKDEYFGLLLMQNSLSQGQL
ncbi:MAG: hypothetical protein COW00_03910 [Bdellovibrio sp. CG12_big_fil_rev_8_21_14_0_65_39_13]|nr:MAG: hypothetical protein COW78_12155 [Bdellovibrio sp. CG22_combo_CG10-13_8_21_14_all_39_27]PIQ61413.1 MAG: hypothetical protein COW00_03910 [Bdellovibrio sp. CG12_big_fil_rev_8_21_14_0_65_39_13]PIR28974.1 MAG: hypothetical protein COV38_12975 [Bdellovibrionales bacterium CG11_big_fil_rev_8_21_14_0_20_38_13]